MTPEEFAERYEITVGEVITRVCEHCSTVLHPGAGEAFYFLGRPSVACFETKLGVDEEGFRAIGLLDLIRLTGQMWDRIRSSELYQSPPVGRTPKCHDQKRLDVRVLLDYLYAPRPRSCFFADNPPPCPNTSQCLVCPTGLPEPQPECTPWYRSKTAGERRQILSAVNTLADAVADLASVAMEEEDVEGKMLLWQRAAAEAERTRDLCLEHAAMYAHLLDTRTGPDEE